MKPGAKVGMPSVNGPTVVMSALHSRGACCAQVRLGMRRFRRVSMSAGILLGSRSTRVQLEDMNRAREGECRGFGMMIEDTY